MSDQPSNPVAGKLEFTGERFVPGTRGNIELEHLHRYLQACEIAAGKVVLDIASGEGYGSAMLANSAARVIGVDISVEAVEHARNRYPKDNLEFVAGSCVNIPLPDASVDLVVSFETIEHHDQHEKMLREIKRVLRPAGVLLISSPDRRHYSEEPAYNNPFHVKELYRHEFRQLLGKHFRNISYFGQRIVHGSGIFAESLATPVSSYRQIGGSVSSAPGLVTPVYWIALASDAKLPALASGIFEQPIDESELVQLWRSIVAERDGQLANLNQAIATRDSRISDFALAVSERDERIAQISQAVAERDKRAVDLSQTVADRDGQIARLGQIVSERDTQIAGLSHGIAERDRHIARLSQAVTERDGQVVDLNQVVGDRDGHIANLNQIIAERDEQIAALNAAVASLDGQIANLRQTVAALYASHSWGLTGPLRAIKRWFSGE